MERVSSIPCFHPQQDIQYYYTPKMPVFFAHFPKELLCAQLCRPGIRTGREKLFGIRFRSLFQELTNRFSDRAFLSYKAQGWAVKLSARIQLEGVRQIRPTACFRLREKTTGRAF